MACIVCFEERPLLSACCADKACETCWLGWIGGDHALRMAEDGLPCVRCVSPSCSKLLPLHALRARATPDLRDALDIKAEEAVLVVHDEALKAPPIGTTLGEFYLHHLGTFCPRCEARFIDNTGCCHITCPRCAKHFCMLCACEYPRDKIYQHLADEHFGQCFVSTEIIQAYKARRIVLMVRAEAERRGLGLMEDLSSIMRREIPDQDLNPLGDLPAWFSFDCFDRRDLVEDPDAFFQGLRAPKYKNKNKLKPDAVRILAGQPQRPAARARLEEAGAREAREQLIQDLLLAEGDRTARAAMGRALYPNFPHWTVYEQSGLQGVAEAVVATTRPADTPVGHDGPRNTRGYRRRGGAATHSFGVAGDIGAVLDTGLWPALQDPSSSLLDFIRHDRGINGVAMVPPTSLRLVRTVCAALPEHRRPDTVVLVSETLNYVVVLGGGVALKALFPRTPANDRVLQTLAGAGEPVLRVDPEIVRVVADSWAYDGEAPTPALIEETARRLLSCTETPTHFLGRDAVREMALGPSGLVVVISAFQGGHGYLDLWGVEDGKRPFGWNMKEHTTGGYGSTHSGDLDKVRAQQLLVRHAARLAPPGTRDVQAWAQSVLDGMGIVQGDVVHIMLLETSPDPNFKFDLYAHGYQETDLAHWRGVRAYASLACAPLVPGSLQAIAVKPPRVHRPRARMFSVVKNQTQASVTVRARQDTYHATVCAPHVFFVQQSRM